MQIVVTFYGGADEYSFVTAGKSVCDVASIALERFNSEWWPSPIPTPDTVLRASLVGYERRYRVTVERVLALLGSRRNLLLGARRVLILHSA